MNIGILGIGTYLPDQVRKNDWWPKSYVDAWREKRVNRMTRGAIPDDVPVTEGVRLVAQEMEAMAQDPFDGCLERRVMPDWMTSGDMEVLAGQRALADAGIAPDEIDVLLVQSLVADHAVINNAANVHERLGLRQRILALETQGACNGFLMQLEAARHMLSSGTLQRALIIQCAPSSRIIEPRDPYSVWLGDGASAVVLGPVSPGRGVLATSTRTDGRFHRALVGAVEEEGARWYDPGTVKLRSLDPLAGRKMLLTSADLGKQVIDEVLAEAGYQADEVAFFACHQASGWFRRAAQRLCGLDKAHTVDIYSWAGNLAGASLPIVMQIGAKERLIQDGDLVAMYGGGAGMTWSAALLRWGR